MGLMVEEMHHQAVKILVGHYTLQAGVMEGMV
jgi:hypothetical protein